jgi:hypothetical protein
MDDALIAAYAAVIQDLAAAQGWEPAAKLSTLKVLLQRQTELENWDLYSPVDEVPD